jgi:hypothetical protein
MFLVSVLDNQARFFGREKWQGNRAKTQRILGQIPSSFPTTPIHLGTNAQDCLHSRP